MIYVGITEMKSRLNEYVRQVRDGETVLVTDQGKIVAKLTGPDEVEDRPIDSESADSKSALESEGLLSSRGNPNNPALYEGLKPLMQKGMSLKLLDAERGDD